MYEEGGEFEIGEGVVEGETGICDDCDDRDVDEEHCEDSLKTGGKDPVDEGASDGAGGEGGLDTTRG